MSNILESMQNLFAMKLVNWQMEGREEEVNQCILAMKCFDSNLACDSFYEARNGRKVGNIPCKPITQDVQKWIFGYCKSKGCASVEMEESEYFLGTGDNKEKGICHRIVYTLQERLK